MLSTTNKKLLGIGAAFYFVLTLCSLHIPFFWDTILTSSIAQWFYDNGIQNGIAPLTWDAGHPTLFQLYLTSLWKIFGKTLPVSHLAMFPFLLWLCVAFIAVMDAMKITDRGKMLGMSLLLLHPYILTQSTLISYDILQIAFFLTTFYGILYHKRCWIVLGIILLSSCSVRGQILSAFLLMAYSIYHFREFGKISTTIIFSALPVILWNVYHFNQTGWMLSTPSSSWENHRSFADFTQMAKNIFGIVRCFVDYGIIALTLTFFGSLSHFKSLQEEAVIKKYIFTFLIVFMGTMVVMTAVNNPIGHRYFMILHVGMILWLALIWEKLQWKKIVLPLIFISFISGHFWIYPDKISNGWDVTLQYVNYEKNRSQLYSFIQEDKIAPQQIASAFPLFCSLAQTDLKQGERMIDISEIDIQMAEYIAYSPVCNDIKDIDKDELQNSFQILKVFGKGMTRVELYGRK